MAAVDCYDDIISRIGHGRYVRIVVPIVYEKLYRFMQRLVGRHRKAYIMADNIHCRVLSAMFKGSNSVKVCKLSKWGRCDKVMVDSVVVFNMNFMRSRYFRVPLPAAKRYLFIANDLVPDGRIVRMLNDGDAVDENSIAWFCVHGGLSVIGYNVLTCTLSPRIDVYEYSDSLVRDYIFGDYAGDAFVSKACAWSPLNAYNTCLRLMLDYYRWSANDRKSVTRDLVIELLNGAVDGVCEGCGGTMNGLKYGLLLVCCGTWRCWKCVLCDCNGRIVMYYGGDVFWLCALESHYDGESGIYDDLRLEMSPAMLNEEDYIYHSNYLMNVHSMVESRGGEGLYDGKHRYPGISLKPVIVEGSVSGLRASDERRIVSIASVEVDTRIACGVYYDVSKFLDDHLKYYYMITDLIIYGVEQRDIPHLVNMCQGSIRSSALRVYINLSSDIMDS